MSIIEKIKIGLLVTVLSVLLLAIGMITSHENKPEFDDQGLRKDVCLSTKGKMPTGQEFQIGLHIEESNEKKLYIVAYGFGQEIGFVRTDRNEVMEALNSKKFEIKACKELGISVE